MLSLLDSSLLIVFFVNIINNRLYHHHRHHKKYVFRINCDRRLSRGVLEGRLSPIND